jgi:hypothetical protein
MSGGGSDPGIRLASPAKSLVHSYRRVTVRYRPPSQQLLKEVRMSSLIAKQPKDTRKQTTVSLKGSVVADLELYCQFIDSARDWVINEALKNVFSKDKAFLDWKERGIRAPNGNGPPHPVPAPPATKSTH